MDDQLRRFEHAGGLCSNRERNGTGSRDGGESAHPSGDRQEPK
jgi:hypothetical protein